MSDDAETVEILIREVADGDMEAIQDIYAHHVLEGLASFEETPPDVAELTRRRDAILDAGYPYLVAEATGENGGKVQGYAYVSAYRPRPAYLHTVENSVYVATGTQRQGIGGRLLEGLIERCTEQGFRQMIAIIGDSDNHPSIGLHARLGFEMIGVLPSVGFKFGRWVDQVIMQRPLGEGSESLPDSLKK
ncbi:MAG TPA: N-acetyltransferase family protein [Rhodospirillales bacterium]|jgi:phosphinothricin acetyltransferase|nr:N-acetyltransferase family protein [Rhodospirillales bacterium]